VLCDRSFRADRPHTGPPIGFCASCAAELGMVPVEDLLSLDAAAGDRLPLGFIAVDRDGVIQGFNAMESTCSGLAVPDVVGRSFFHDVAPCTSVKEFEGLFPRMVETEQAGVARFRYVFRFAGGERLVQISMTYVPAEQRGIIIVRDLDAAERRRAAPDSTSTIPK
jgi:photoactive yellow protein